MAFSQPVEMWGTFSVVDHCRPDTFVTELMLYDRLVIPVPPKDKPDERQRWRDEGWNPDRLDDVIARLGDLAIPMEWDETRRERVRSRLTTARSLNGYAASSQELRLEIELGFDVRPVGVKDVIPVAAYDSPEEFGRDIQLRLLGQRDKIDTGHLAAILARAFLVPERIGGNDFENLARAIEIARDPEFREKRGHFHAWLRDVVRNGLAETSAILEMRDLVTEYQAVLDKRKLQQTLKYAFFVSKLAVYGMGAASVVGAIPPLGAATSAAAAAVLAAEFVTRGASVAPGRGLNNPAAMFYDARRHFGWS